MPSAKSVKQQSLSEIVAVGDSRQSLEALRDRLAVELEAVSGAPVASLAKQLVEVLAKLDAVRAPEESKLDDLAKRRASRLGPQVSKRAGGGVSRSGSGGNRTRG